MSRVLLLLLRQWMGRCIGRFQFIYLTAIITNITQRPNRHEMRMKYRSSTSPNNRQTRPSVGPLQDKRGVDDACRLERLVTAWTQPPDQMKMVISLSLSLVGEKWAHTVHWESEREKTSNSWSTTGRAWVYSRQMMNGWWNNNKRWERNWPAELWSRSASL